jgi:nicotinamidase-related amidase
MSTPPTINLLIIDPQNDFVSSEGALSVAGAEQDAERLAHLIDHARSRITHINLSLDSHNRLDISHPLWFYDDNGRSPDPFTVIKADDLSSQRWMTREEVSAYTLNYLRMLEDKGRYPHVIWPEHCLIGGEGHLVYPLIREALYEWSAQPAHVDYVIKGMNPLTEHFSAVEAELPLADDPHTQANRGLIQRLVSSDVVWVAGWARSHCVGSTLRDLFKWGGRSLAEKTVLITDTMSDVTGFEEHGEQVVKDALKWGAQLADVSTLLQG